MAKKPLFPESMAGITSQLYDPAQGGLSAFVPTRPTDQLRRGILSLIPDSVDQVTRQRLAGMAEGLSNVSTLPWLSDLGYSGVEAAARPSRRTALDLGLAAAGLIPGIRGKGKLLKTAVKEAAPATSTALKDLFDMSRLHEMPKVPQAPLPRYEPKKGPSQRVQDLIANKNVRDQMIEGIQRGIQMGGGHWYNTEPLRARMVETLGKDLGNQRHTLYADMMGAASPRSKMPENVRNASYYSSLVAKGEPLPEIGATNPEPYGHLAQKMHQRNARNIMEGTWNYRTNPKPPSFSAGLKGNLMPVAVDAHAFKAPAILAQDPRFLSSAFKVNPQAESVDIRNLVETGKMNMSDVRPAMWESKPAENEYKAMEDYYTGLARDVGLHPAQAQASGWQAFAPLTGLQSDDTKAFMNFFGDRIMHTAQVTGKDPMDVLKDFIKGGRLKSVAAPVGGAGILGAMGLSAAGDGQQQR